jgi:hypothetical protein
MNAYVYTLFVIVSLILIGLIIYFQVDNGILKEKVTKPICPKGCKKGKCMDSKKCFECNPYQMNCCCYDEQCRDCVDDLEEEEEDNDKVYSNNYREKIVKQNEYIKKINMEIQAMNAQL